MGFLFGGKTGETAESLARKRAVTEALMASANGGVAQTVGEGIAQLGQALSGRLGANALQKKQDVGRAALAERIRNAFAGGAPGATGSASIPMSGAASEMSSSAPATPVNMDGNQVYGDFIDTVKGGITNPYGLAAVAATGKAESGYSPENVNRTWSDPSESGQPGRAGGIMSWRGPRYEALAATGDLSPAGQAKFFLSENPDLIAKLNNAKSLDEAQGLMNSAWQFAGYNRPGGETARRFGLAQGFLPTFQGQGTEVASLDPKAGIPAAPSVPAATPLAAIQAAAPASGYVDPQVTTSARRPAVAAALAGNAPAPAAAPRSQVVAQALNGPHVVAQAAPSDGGALGFNPDLLDILSDPYISREQSAAVQAVIDRQLADRAARAEEARKRADPGYQLGLEKTRLEVDALKNPKLSPADQARIDLDKDKFDFDKSKPTEVGGRLIGPDGKVIYEAPGKWQKLDDGSLFNEATGEFRTAPKPEGQSGFRFKGSSVEAQSLNGLIDSGTLTEDQAQQLGAGKTVSGPNGEIIFMTPQGVFAGQDGKATPLVPPQPAQQQLQQPYVDLFGTGGGSPAPAAPAAQSAPAAPAQRQGMIPITGPKVTVDESKAGGFADRMVQADKDLAGVGDVATGWAGTFGNLVSDNDYIPDSAESRFMTSDFQKFDQARRAFINSQLRRESGAAIGKDEYANANKMYFPMPGDSKDTIAQKAAARQAAIKAMIRDAGPTYGKPKADEATGDMPDFSKMSDEELQRFIDGK